MIGRGEHAEIVAFVGKTVDSELSGNMIDLCPVGALTSKPFRYSARTWELSRRKSVSPHDGLGANLVVQVKQNQVMRVLPLENEAINECWLSDKDRFSYEALDSAASGSPRRWCSEAAGWQEIDWQTALERVAEALRAAGPDVGVLASPHATLEELLLAGRLAKALGGSADFRLRHSDFTRRRQARRRALARHADRRARRAGSRAGGRFVPAQGPSADRAAPAPGGQARRADQRPALQRTTTC